MSESPSMNGDDAHLEPPLTNAQLATPALSPISEHGDRQTQPFPSYEIGAKQDGGVDGVKKVAASNISPIDTKITESRDRRKSSISSPKTAKLSPTQLQELVQSPENLPVRALEDPPEDIAGLGNGLRPDVGLGLNGVVSSTESATELSDHHGSSSSPQILPQIGPLTSTPSAVSSARPTKPSRSASTPLIPQEAIILADVEDKSGASAAESGG